MKKKTKHNNKNNNNLLTGRINTLLCRGVFQIITRKERNVYVHVLSKNLQQSVPYAQNESCLACK